MSLRIYNTQAKTKEEFIPVEQGQVKMYCCGPTVYDLLHVGNFRGAIFFNLVRNWFVQSGYEVTFVYNYTDIDDKIIKRANEEGVTPKELSQKYITEFEKDFASLKLTAHDQNPKATDFIDQMIALIEDLVANDRAYVIDGEVFFSIDNFQSYGKLSGKNLEELEAGYRIDADVRKKNPFDFVLWKPSKEGEPAWDSPWGAGRPGWHIECSTMIRTLLGDSIDIHGGGIDLIFPHHENEIAQSEGATDKPFVKYWMHNNFINFGTQKMSKSLGNVVKGREFIERFHPEVLKFLILSVHYRSILNLGDDQVYQAIGGLTRIYTALLVADEALESPKEIGQIDAGFQKVLDEASESITQALNDDFNTPQMFASVFDVVRAFNNGYARGRKVTPPVKAMAQAFKQWIVTWGELTSLFAENPTELLNALDNIILKDKNLTRDQINQLVEDRMQARKEKDFAKSDEIRDQLAGMGVLLQDLPTGTIWEMDKTA